MDSITTLIVEDEPMLAEILVDNIKQFPQFDVIGIADKLESARKQLRLYQPQLILLDNFLPDGKGIDLIRHAVSTHYKGRIIFITADNHMETISEALRLGVFDYLIKPVHYQRLQHTLERFARYRSCAPVNRPASSMSTRCLIFRPGNKRNPPAHHCAGSMKAPFSACSSCLPTRRWCIPPTRWPVSSAAAKPPLAVIWNKE